MSNTSTTSAPESIVVSLEWAKKLKDAGWPQDNAAWFDWAFKGRSAGLTSYEEPPSWKVIPSVQAVHCKFFAAPTAGELVEAIPAMVELEHDGKTRCCYLCMSKDSCWYQYDDFDSIDGACQATAVLHFEEGSLLASLPAMYVFLAEKDLLPKA